MKLPSNFVTEHGAEQLPSFALEPFELYLLDRRKIVRIGVDRDAGQEIVVLKSFRFAACLMTFSRVRSSPHCISTCTSVWALL